MNVGDTVLVLSKYPEYPRGTHFSEGKRHRVEDFNDSFVVLDDGYAYRYDSVLEQGDPRNNTINDIEIGDIVVVVEPKDNYNPKWQKLKNNVGEQCVVTGKNAKHLALSIGGHYYPWWVKKSEIRVLCPDGSEKFPIRGLLKRR